MERNAGLLRLRIVALAIWCACVLLIVIPAITRSAHTPADSPFQQPVQPPGPHPGYPVKD